MAFFLDTKPPRQRFLNAPPAILWLIVLILAAHTARELLAEPAATYLIIDYAFIPSRPAEPLTYLTYLFLHGSYMHVAFNSLWLLVFGPPVAWRIGTARFAGFYLFCGVAAALAHLISDWGSDVPVVGASGAISGLMGGTIRIMYAGRFGPGQSEYPPPLAPISARPVVFFSLVWLTVNLVVGTVGFGFAEEGQLIAWVAHMGGYIAGLLTIGFFDRGSGRQDEDFLPPPRP